MILDFLRNYWKEILEVLVLIGSVVFFIVKKKPVQVVDTIKENICRWLPGVIVAAEDTGLKGGQKLQYCINLLYNLFASDYLTRKEFDNKYLAFVIPQIEAILSTPQKKGDNDGKKN